MHAEGSAEDASLESRIVSLSIILYVVMHNISNYSLECALGKWQVVVRSYVHVTIALVYGH